ncbi:MAG: exosortase A [Burkholderiaceae bacterium]
MPKSRLLVTLLFAVITAAVLIVLWPTTRSMIDTWRQSSAYGHCYLVIPIAIWMAWHESSALTSVPLKPFRLGLVVVAATGFVWLLGELASATVVSQFAAVGMVVATTLTVLGRTWARQLTFPLGFLFFAVPFGEGLLPVLMEWTADFTVGALRVTGIPVYREGNYFILPSGSWSVVEACSGVRYLIAASMVGCLFAWLHYRASIKRVVFVCLALAVALVSNWLRAYAIVLLGHFSNNRLGTGVDHNLLGWLIFGAAMFGMFVIGIRWSDRERRSTSLPAHRGRLQEVSIQAVAAVLVASLLTVAAWPVVARWIESRVDERPIQIEAIAPRGGWQVAAVAPGDWAPDLVAPTAVDVQAFARRDESAVGVYLGMYRGQKQGAELVNTLNQIASTERKRWRLVESGLLDVHLNGEKTSIRTAVVRGANEQFLVWHWYWLGHPTSSDVRAKIELAVQRLIGASDTSAWVAVYTPVADDIPAGVRRLSAFIEAMSGPIDDALEATANR